MAALECPNCKGARFDVDAEAAGMGDYYHGVLEPGSLPPCPACRGAGVMTAADIDRLADEVVALWPVFDEMAPGQIRDALGLLRLLAQLLELEGAEP